MTTRSSDPSPALRSRPGRRIRAVVLSVALVLALVAPPAAASDHDQLCAGATTDAFDDVRPGSTHAANIDCLAAFGITQGVGGDNYAPGRDVPRDQMASFLINFLEVALDGALPAPTRTAAFTDVTGVTHTANVVRAAELDIARGRTPDRFAPRELVTRAQMASFVARTMQTAGHAWPSTVPDAFGDDDGTTHERNIDRLAHAGIVRGVATDRFAPHRHVTRAQMASFLIGAAAVLHGEGVWTRAADEQLEPGVVLVSRPGPELDRLSIRWDRDVTVAGLAVGVEVVNAHDEVVAIATDLQANAADVTATLDRSLVDGEVYWLRLTAGLVVDAKGIGNLDSEVAFSFTTAAPAPGDGSDGSGDGGTGSEPAPTILSATTAPDADHIVVVFDQAVTCPTGVDARNAWAFSNASVIEGTTHATGAPDAVNQSVTPSTSCALVYQADGVEDGDFGMLSYTSPAVASDRVQTDGGATLATVSSVRVSDGKAPTFVGVNADQGTNNFLVSFSEPMACSTVDAAQFAVTIAGTAVAVDSVSCGSPAAKSMVLVVSSTAATGEEVTVSVLAGTTLSDQSLDNQIAASTQSVTVQ